MPDLDQIKQGEQGRRLPAAEQIHPAVDLVAARVMRTPRSPAAVLFLNTTDQDIDLMGWSLATARDSSLGLVGAVRASQPLAVDVPEIFFDADGGVVTLLGSGLKVAAATYPAEAMRCSAGMRSPEAGRGRCRAGGKWRLLRAGRACKSRPIAAPTAI